MPNQISNQTSNQMKQDSLKILNEALNRGCLRGVYNLEEAFVIKSAYNIIEKYITQSDLETFPKQTPNPSTSKPVESSESKNKQDDETLSLENLTNTLQRATKSGKQVKFNDPTDNTNKSV